ncbi:MAG: CoA pyrophosphatase, partial [Nocardioides sp.]
TPILGWRREPAAVSIVSPAEVHAIHHAPIAELLDPEHRVTVRHPRVDYRSPGFLIGPDKDVILWGFTGGIIARLFDYLGWTRPWDQTRVRDLPDYMLQADGRRSRLLDIEDDRDEEAE